MAKNKEYNLDPVAKTAATIRSWEQEDIVLEQTDLTRTIFRWKTVAVDPNLPWANISWDLIVQKKWKNDQWEKTDGIDLTSMKKGEIRSKHLSRQELRRLYDLLHDIYSSVLEVPKAKSKLVQIDGESDVIEIPKDKVVRTKYIQRLIEGEEYSEEIISQILKSDDLSKKLSYAKLYEDRAKILMEFKDSLEDGSKAKDEAYWQAFFENNSWIFWYGLNYQFIHLLKSQAKYGWDDYTRKWEQKWDYLWYTAGDNSKFTVLVEIKTPQTNICMKSDDYKRNWVYPLHNALLNWISQMQINCETWNKDESMQKETWIKLEANKNIHTIQPKWILVIGHSKELDVEPKKYTFESFRRNLHNPEVITFDELYHRASYIVDHIRKDSKEFTQEEVNDDEFDDILEELF